MRAFCDGSVQRTVAGWSVVLDLEPGLYVSCGFRPACSSHWAELEAMFQAITLMEKMAKPHDTLDLYTDYKCLIQLVSDSGQDVHFFQQKPAWKRLKARIQILKQRHKLEIHWVQHGANYCHDLADAYARYSAITGQTIEQHHVTDPEHEATLVRQYGKIKGLDYGLYL